MALERTERRIMHLSPSWRVRVRILPVRVRLLALLLFLLALVVAALDLYGAFGAGPGSSVCRELARHPVAVVAAMAAAVVGALLAMERPRTWSVGAYARQLRGRLREVEAEFDGALRRREGEGMERGHAAPHSLERSR